MKTMTKSAREFVTGVVSYLRKDPKAKTAAGAVATLFRKVTKEARTSRLAQVESAVVLTPLERQGLTQILSKLVGHAVSVEFRLNRALIAGLRIRIADWVVDTSLTGQLENLKQSLLEV